MSWRIDFQELETKSGAGTLTFLFVGEEEEEVRGAQSPDGSQRGKRFTGNERTSEQRE